ncbi:MAG: hypothetical protein GX271_06330 [Clostridiales bacterium]|nr:hypothetical protein [Clostridiales bacterium]
MEQNDSATQGDNINDAIEMGKDAICLLGISLEDDGKEIPKPNTKEYIQNDDDILVFVDVDFTK